MESESQDGRWVAEPPAGAQLERLYPTTPPYTRSTQLVHLFDDVSVVTSPEMSNMASVSLISGDRLTAMKHDTDTHDTDTRAGYRSAHPTVMEAIEQAFGGPLPLVDAPAVSYGGFGTWHGEQVIDQTNPLVTAAVANVRSTNGLTRKAFAQAANIRSPKDLDAILRARPGRGAAFVRATS